MELVKKNVFVARDGREFDNEQDCARWEELLLTPEPIHLQDDQIVGLLRRTYPEAFYHWAKDNHAAISLKVKRSLEGSGFDFWFAYTVDKQQLNFTGQVFGERSLVISQSYEGADGYERSKDWDQFDMTAMQAGYEYLDSIGYFTPREELLPENPNLKKKDWTEIFRDDYLFVRAEIIE